MNIASTHRTEIKEIVSHMKEAGKALSGLVSDPNTVIHLSITSKSEFLCEVHESGEVIGGGFVPNADQLPDLLEWHLN
jgi:hypothetical protein